MNFPFKVEPFSEDNNGRLSWRFLGNHLLRCASLHAGTLGFGYEDVEQNHRAWVLSRLVIELESMPRTGQDYSVDTWVASVYRQFTDRHFSILSPRGEAFGYATSVWALIDIDSRQPIDLASLPGSGIAAEAGRQPLPIAPFGRIRVKQGEPVHTLTARYSDLDINGHVNSIRYVEMVLDLFSETLAQGGRVKRIEMAYCTESYLGDRLALYLEPGEGRRQVEIRKAQPDGQPDIVVVKAAVEISR